MHHVVRWRLIVAAVLLSVSGCGATEPLSACSDPVSITVSEGTTPRIAWTPACGVERLVVSQAVPPSMGVATVQRWAIRADGRLIEPAVRYALPPRGATVDVPAEPLAAGRPSGVELFGPTVSVGFKSFTP